MVGSSTRNGALSDTSHARALRGLLTDIVRELRGPNSSGLNISLPSKLDRDLGIDSLGRTELIMRIERAFRIRLPISVMSEANTVGDLLTAIERATLEVRPSEASPVEEPSKNETLAVAPATEADTLVDVLEWHVARNPDRAHLTILQDEDIVLSTITYADLARSAKRVAAGLIGRDVIPGDRVALMLPTCADFFAAFFGVFYAGAVPVPIYPPMQLSQLEDYLRRQASILRNAETRILITVSEALSLGGLLRGLVPSLGAIESVKNLAAVAGAAALPRIDDPKATALIQYTSGSTGDPKGVVLSHANLLANIRALFTAIEATPSDVLISWLPLYHDMGLIGAWLAPLYGGARCYIMSPLSFLAHPQSWLWACHRY